MDETQQVTLVLKVTDEASSSLANFNKQLGLLQGTTATAAASTAMRPARRNVRCIAASISSRPDSGSATRTTPFGWFFAPYEVVT